MAGQRNIYRIARTLLLALAALLAVGAVGSMFLGSRAVSQAKAAAVDQAQTIVENSLPLALAPSDVTAPATDAKADLITAKITPVLLDPTRVGRRRDLVDGRADRLLDRSLAHRAAPRRGS